MSKKAIVWDHGLFVDLAIRIARELGDCLYHSPWQSSSPHPVDQLIGSGLEEFGVERVDFPLELIGTADEPETWIFPDLYFTDLQGLLRSLGKNVWGSGWGELLELDRLKLHTVLKNAGHPTLPITNVVGTMNLERYLRDGDEAWIKIAQYYRGLMETYHHRGWPQSETWFNKRREMLGPAARNFQFMLQEPIDGNSVEPGIDMLILDGDPVWPALLGYERKNTAILSKVITGLPNSWASPLAAVFTELSSTPYSNFFSAEIRRTEDGLSYLTDATCRMPRPSDAVHMMMWKNLGKVMTAGELPEPAAKYAAQILLTSDALMDGPLHVAFPKELRAAINMWHYYRDEEGEYWVIPQLSRDPVFASACAIGDSVDEVTAKALEIAEAIEADDAEFEQDAFVQIEKDIEQGVKNGIDW